MTASQDAVGTARGRRIVQLADPIDDTDAANKGYVDANSGGAQTFTVVRFPIAYNTPGAIVGGGGIELYVPAVNDYWAWVAQGTTTAWNGSTPNGYIFSTGDTYSTDYAVSWDLSLADVVPASWGSAHFRQSAAFDLMYVGGFAVDAAPLRFIYDDGSGGNPGSSQGAGEILLFFAVAS